MSELRWKRNVHLPEFKAKVTVREIQVFLAEQYGTEVLPELIRSITVAVTSQVTVRQARAVEPMYLLDGLH